jgi:hemerythrin-like domain-containing protein
MLFEGGYMKPRGLLMIEHRLIEKMISLIKKELARLNSGESQKPDPKFLDNAIDFIRTYADRTHHGKEEDILFAKLAEKNIQGDDAGFNKRT